MDKMLPSFLQSGGYISQMAKVPQDNKKETNKSLPSDCGTNVMENYMISGTQSSICKQ